MIPPSEGDADQEGSPEAAAELQASVQRDMARLEAYRDQLTALVREQELLRISLESHARARQTLEEFEKFQKDRELLVPVGAETFIQATPRSTEKVLLGIGHGIVVELDRPKALEILGRRNDELQKGEHSLNQQLRRIEIEAAQVQSRLQAFYQQAQMAQGGPNPPASNSAPLSGGGRKTGPRST